MAVSQSTAGDPRRSAPPADARVETDLMGRIAAGDLRAFEALYRRFHPRLTRFLLNMTHRPPLVEEVLNDTMLMVWRQPGRYNGASKPSTWIFAIAYRKALSALRRQDQPVEDRYAEHRRAPEPDPEQSLEDSQTQALLRAAMEGLSADHRAVVDLTYFHEMGYREIAEIMACPVDTVKTRMFHARRHLKRSLEGQLSDRL